MKTTIAFLALSLCAAAQTSKFTTDVATVTLSGEVHNPMITNHSGKQIIAAMVIRQQADGIPTVSQRLFTHDANVLPDGGSVEFGEYSRRPTSREVSAKITAVIFADGEFRGEDYDSFQSGTERRLQNLRQTWQMAKDGQWDKLKAKVDAGAAKDDIFAVELARRLLEFRALHNDSEAVNAFAHNGNLPASTWKGGLLNKLRIPQMYQAMADWFVPIVAHATPNYTSIGPYPQSGTIDDYHPGIYDYHCYTYPNPPTSYPCPDQLQTTTTEGIKAYCTDNGGYNIAASANLSVDTSSGNFRMNIDGGEQVTNNELKVWGQCLENENTDRFSRAQPLCCRANLY
jgi:hypothetical protein